MHLPDLLQFAFVIFGVVVLMDKYCLINFETSELPNQKNTGIPVFQFKKASLPD
jgi:hypothetical protein